MERVLRKHPSRRQRAKTHPRPRYSRHDRNKSILWSLPEEVLLHLLQNLHIKELLSMNATHPYLRDLIQKNPSVWQSVSFHGTWPTVPNMHHFKQAAKHNNLEALVKLGVAFLYNEGLPGDFEGQKITANGERAAEMFCKVESITPNVSPFTWLFIRPPWAMLGACCKECVFSNMREYVKKTPDASVHICIAKTMGILDMEEYKSDIEVNLRQAAELGSSEAAFLLWTQKYCNCCRVLDSATNLECLRDLRVIAQTGYYEAQLVLCKRYVSGTSGGLGKRQAAGFVRKFIQNSRATRVKTIYRFEELTHSMRYILVDWLVEVACMKDFSSLTLHMAVSVVDRFLQKHKTTRARLQLLGVAAMVLCSRFLGMEIITIREAAWLTDNTYKYEDVVRMMGEITASLGGNFRVPVCLDYVTLLNTATQSDQETSLLAEYFCELAMLQSDLGDFPMSQVASSCVLLSRMVQNKENPWTVDMVNWTGFEVPNLHKCVLLLHEKCFMDQALVDHREVTLQAVKERYSDQDDFMAVSTIQVMNKTDLRQMLGVPEEKPVIKPVTPRSKSPKDLIASPCRGGSGKVTMNSCSVNLEQDREQAATPTMEAMKKGGRNRLNESIGYDGDREDEGESFIDHDGDDSDCDLEPLWRTEQGEGIWRSHHDLSSVEEEDDESFLQEKPGGSKNTARLASMPVGTFTIGGASSSTTTVTTSDRAFNPVDLPGPNASHPVIPGPSNVPLVLPPHSFISPPPGSIVLNVNNIPVCHARVNIWENDRLTPGTIAETLGINPSLSFLRQGSTPMNTSLTSIASTSSRFPSATATTTNESLTTAGKSDNHSNGTKGKTRVALGTLSVLNSSNKQSPAASNSRKRKMSFSSESDNKKQALEK